MMEIAGNAMALIITMIAAYVIIAVMIITIGMIAGLFVRPTVWLASRVLALFGVQWKFRPRRRVLVIEGDGRSYISREIWHDTPDDWMAWSDFSNEWLLGAIVTAIAWPLALIESIGWIIKRLTRQARPA